jgi:hypothetical protein
MASQYYQSQVSAVDGILFRLRCYRDPNRIRNDVLELLKTTPSLQPRAGTLGNNLSIIFIRKYSR